MVRRPICGDLPHHPPGHQVGTGAVTSQGDSYLQERVLAPARVPLQTLGHSKSNPYTGEDSNVASNDL